MIDLVLWIAVAAIVAVFAYWALNKIPMPDVVKTAIQIAVAAFLIIIVLIVLFRLVDGGLPTLSLR